jgi:N6-L-threonylcarbamoyladenine synthase
LKALGNTCGFFNLTFADGSSDDTSVALLEKTEIPHAGNWPRGYKSPLATLHFHKTITSDNVKHKGIHPIEALDSHRQNLAVLANHALEHLPSSNMKTSRSQSLILQSGLTVGLQKRKPDFVTVTRGPGNRSNLSCGLDLAKGLSVAWQVPLLAVHHMQAHALTPRLAWAMKSDSMTVEQKPPEPEFPFLSLLVSGGHTMLLHSTSVTDHTVLASTTDIAVGEALDKIGRLVLPTDRLTEVADTAYAKHLTQYAFRYNAEYASYALPQQRRDEISKQHNKFGWAIQTPFADTKELAFSFSGIASRIQALFEERQAAVKGGISNEERVLFARTALGTAFEHLASRTIIAIDKTIKFYKDESKLPTKKQSLRTLVVSGGVAANGFLRHVLREMLDSRGFMGIEIVSPPVELCTDNAAMIGWCGIEMYEEGWRSSLTVDPLRNWSMDTDSDGLSGIVGVPGWAKARKRSAEDEWFGQGMSQKQVGSKMKLLRLRRLNKFNRLHKTQVEGHHSGKLGKVAAEASKALARSPAKREPSQGHLGSEVNHGPVDIKISREWLPRNEFGNINGIFRKTNSYAPRSQL